MEYQKERERRLQRFEDILHICERNAELLSAIQWTRERTMLYRSSYGMEDGYDSQRQPADVNDRSCREIDEWFSGISGKHKLPCRLIVTEQDMLEKAQLLYQEDSDRRIGIWNFACAMQPGGSVFRGGAGQEENLCRCSTLYPCLDTGLLQQRYYEPNREDLREAGTCILTPGIVCLDANNDRKQWNRRENWFTVDVLSCTAPEWERTSGPETLPCEKGRLSDPQEWKKLLCVKRRGLLQAAADARIDVLVIGISGIIDT